MFVSAGIAIDAGFDAGSGVTGPGVEIIGVKVIEALFIGATILLTRG